MSQETMVRLGIALVLGVAAFAIVFRLGVAAGAIAQDARPDDDRRAGARRRVRIATGIAGALALGVTAVIASIVPTGAGAAQGAPTATEPAPDGAGAAATAVDPAAAVDAALPGIDEGAGDPYDDDDGRYGDDGDEDGLGPPQQLPQSGGGGHGFGSGGS